MIHHFFPMLVKPMNEILEGLFLGDEYDARDWSSLERNHIGAIVNCTTRVPNHFEERHLAYLHLKLEETSKVSPDIARSVTEFVREHETSGNILVHCAGGMQRAPAIMILILLHEGHGFIEAFDIIEQKLHVTINPAFAMMVSIARLDLGSERVTEDEVRQFYRDRYRLFH
jgi:predicted protein tyrosine phosphatase